MGLDVEGGKDMAWLLEKLATDSILEEALTWTASEVIGHFGGEGRGELVAMGRAVH